MKKIYLLIVFLITFSSIHADIIDVTIFFRAELCDRDCIRTLERSFRSLPGVRGVQPSPSSGTIKLFWRPRAAFDYRQINLIMQRLGLKLSSLDLTVRGTVTQAGNRFFLDSLGDPTRMELLNRPAPSDTQFVERKNIQTHVVRNPLREQLIEAKAQDALLRIQGTLFAPHRNDNKLIVNTIRVD
ncbi:MAG: hypothetical protein Tsb0021_13450 [Chlamydiales bacterium]